ncbi:MAG: hypothetical protein V3T86_00450 [Planctomycetota bacterium]
MPEGTVMPRRLQPVLVAVGVTLGGGAVIRHRVMSGHTDFFTVLGLATLIAVVWTFAIRQRIARKLLLGLSALLFAVTLIELGFWTLKKTAKQPVSHYVTPGFGTRDPVLGTRANPGGPYVARKSDDRVIFEAQYTIDRNRLRTTLEATDPTRTVLFFGGSNTFGEGVNDSETTSSRVVALSDGRVRAYNFGLGGYGTHHMLLLLEEGHVAAAVKPVGRVVAVYYLIPDHLRRAAGLVWFDRRSQLFELGPSGSLHRAPARASDPKNWLDGSALYRRLHRNPAPIERRHYDLLAAIVKESGRRLAELYDGCELHVVIEEREWLRKELDSRGVSPRQVPPLPATHRFRDGHLNADGHDRLARFVWTEILGGDR